MAALLLGMTSTDTALTIITIATLASLVVILHIGSRRR